MEARVEGKEIIGRYRPKEVSVKSIKDNKIPFDCDDVFLYRDISLVLEVLNKEGYKNLNTAFEDHTSPEYLRELGEFKKALIEEFFHEFFQNHYVPMAHMNIREFLSSTTTTTITNEKNDEFKESLEKYLAGIDEIFYFSKFQYPRRNDAPPRLNLLLVGTNENTQKVLSMIYGSSPRGIIHDVSHHHSQPWNPLFNADGLVFCFDGAFISQIIPNNNNQANDARNNFKERVTVPLEQKAKVPGEEMFIPERKDWKDLQYISYVDMQMEDLPQHILNRYIPIKVSDSEFSLSEGENEESKKHKRLHGLYFMIIAMIRSGVIEIPLERAESFIGSILNTIAQNNNIICDEERRKYVLENAISRCIIYAVWPFIHEPLSVELIQTKIVPHLLITAMMCESAVETMFPLYDSSNRKEFIY